MSSLPICTTVTRIMKIVKGLMIINDISLPPFYERCCNPIGYATYYLVFYRYRVKSVAPMISYYSIRYESALLIR